MPDSEIPASLPRHSTGSAIRLVVQEPCLAKYRVPVYRELAARDDIDLTVLYGDVQGIANMEPEGFQGHLVPLKQWRMGGQELLWHSAQLHGASSATADVLILDWNIRYLSIVPALLRARQHGISTILWGHGYSKQERPAKRALRRSISKLATALLFYDERSATQFVEAGWPKERVFVAPNALDQAPIQKARDVWLNDPARLDQFRRQHDLIDAKLLLYVSRLLPENRLDLLLEAAALLKPKFPSLKVGIIGGGGTESRRLIRRAHELGISSRVRFLGSIYDECELAPWFLSADMFVYPANIGLSVLHAFGYGLPVVTSNAIDAQNPEIIALRDGENGRLYDHGNVVSLAEMIAEVLQDEDLARNMSIAARHTVENEFSLSNMVDGIVDATRSCWRRAGPHGCSQA